MQSSGASDLGKGKRFWSLATTPTTTGDVLAIPEKASALVSASPTLGIGRAHSAADEVKAGTRIGSAGHRLRSRCDLRSAQARTLVIGGEMLVAE